MRLRLIAIIGLLALVVAACGDSTATTTVPAATAPPTTQPPAGPPAAELDIVIGTAADPDRFAASLTCGARDVGTGFLAKTAAEACSHLSGNEAARNRLVTGVADYEACTGIYGGGEVAAVTGTLGNDAVDTTIDRADGCGIADWELLQPILVAPYDLQPPDTAAACSGAGVAVPDGPAPSLPAPVAATWQRLVADASSCDLGGLAALALADGTTVSFGGAVDPAETWRTEEDAGYAPMAALLQVMALDQGVVAEADLVVWPAVAALDRWEDATEEQRQELAAIFGAEALAGWDEFGGYVGYRVGIEGDGTWAFFVAGD